MPCRVQSVVHQARSLGAHRLNLQITSYSCCVPVMDSERHEDSGEMYSPDNQGEYTLLDEVLQFSMLGLSDVLAGVGEGKDETPAEEYTMMLEVTMADHPGRPHPPTFS